MSELEELLSEFDEAFPGSHHQQEIYKRIIVEARSIEEGNAWLLSVISDFENDKELVLAEKCPSDEHHCTCVPILRAEINRLREAARWIPVWESLPEKDIDMDDERSIPVEVVLANGILVSPCHIKNGTTWFGPRGIRLMFRVAYWRRWGDLPEETFPKVNDWSGNLFAAD